MYVHIESKWEQTVAAEAGNWQSASMVDEVCASLMRHLIMVLKQQTPCGLAKPCQRIREWPKL